MPDYQLLQTKFPTGKWEEALKKIVTEKSERFFSVVLEVHCTDNGDDRHNELTVDVVDNKFIINAKILRGNIDYDRLRTCYTLAEAFLGKMKSLEPVNSNNLGKCTLFINLFSNSYPDPSIGWYSEYRNIMNVENSDGSKVLKAHDLRMSHPNDHYLEEFLVHWDVHN